MIRSVSARLRCSSRRSSFQVPTSVAACSACTVRRAAAAPRGSSAPNTSRSHCWWPARAPSSSGHELGVALRCGHPADVGVAHALVVADERVDGALGVAGRPPNGPSVVARPRTSATAITTPILEPKWLSTVWWDTPDALAIARRASRRRTPARGTAWWRRRRCGRGCRRRRRPGRPSCSERATVSRPPARGRCTGGTAGRRRSSAGGGSARGPRRRSAARSSGSASSRIAPNMSGSCARVMASRPCSPTLCHSAAVRCRPPAGGPRALRGRGARPGATRSSSSVAASARAGGRVPGRAPRLDLCVRGLERRVDRSVLRLHGVDELVGGRPRVQQRPEHGVLAGVVDLQTGEHETGVVGHDRGAGGIAVGHAADERREGRARGGRRGGPRPCRARR